MSKNRKTKEYIVGFTFGFKVNQYYLAALGDFLFCFKKIGSNFIVLFFFYFKFWTKKAFSYDEYRSN
jgi:hypothetical protein